MRRRYGNYTEYSYRGKMHRKNGPAAIYSDGTKYYYIHGKRHRIDGPAIIHKNGDVEYYIDDVELTKKEFDMYHFVNTL